ncbi:MAG: glycosyltransferase, partial [Candidatus Hodarchaeota archaeon]
GPKEMQIEVVDNCSNKDDPESLIKDFSGGRVSFYRQPHNVGAIQNFNTCIERSFGQIVHILHSDDLVLPGFYNHLREAFEKEPTIGAAFCRHIIVDEERHLRYLLPLERSEPGVLTGLLERIAVKQLIYPAGIVVRRSSYEKLGGFHLELIHAGDWEMWKRIAAHYPVWYEPQPLACYRVHSSSITSQLIRSGVNIGDCRRAIEISQSYLPDATAGELSDKAREFYALLAINGARQKLALYNMGAVLAHIREALKCSHSLRVTKSVVRFFVGLQEPSVFRLVVKLLFGERGTKVIKRMSNLVSHRD